MPCRGGSTRLLNPPPVIFGKGKTNSKLLSFSCLPVDHRNLSLIPDSANPRVIFLHCSPRHAYTSPSKRAFKSAQRSVENFGLENRGHTPISARQPDANTRPKNSALQACHPGSRVAVIRDLVREAGSHPVAPRGPGSPAASGVTGSFCAQAVGGSLPPLFPSASWDPGNARRPPSPHPDFRQERGSWVSGEGRHSTLQNRRQTPNCAGLSLPAQTSPALHVPPGQDRG